MKKLIMILALTSMGMLSCKKDRTCSCTYTQTVTNNNNTNSSSTTQDYTIVKETKRIAKLACVHKKWTDASNNNTHTNDMDCKLK